MWEVRNVDDRVVIDNKYVPYNIAPAAMYNLQNSYKKRVKIIRNACAIAIIRLLFYSTCPHSLNISDALYNQRDNFKDFLQSLVTRTFCQRV